MGRKSLTSRMGGEMSLRPLIGEMGHDTLQAPQGLERKGNRYCVNRCNAAVFHGTLKV